MNEQLRPARSISDVRRPSRYQTTMPQTMPSGRPLKKMATTLKFFGATANRSSAVCAIRIIATRLMARLPDLTSEQILMPMTLDSA